MMKSAENRLGDECSADLDRPPLGRILLQREMCAGLVVVGHVSAEHVAEVALTKDQHVVQAFPPH